MATELQWMKAAAGLLLVLTLSLPVTQAQDQMPDDILNQLVPIRPYLYPSKGIAGQDHEAVFMDDDPNEWFYFNVEQPSKLCDEPNQMTFTSSATGEVLTIVPRDGVKTMLLVDKDILTRNILENNTERYQSAHCFTSVEVPGKGYAFSSNWIDIDGDNSTIQQLAYFDGKEALALSQGDDDMSYYMKNNNYDPFTWIFSSSAMTAASNATTTAAPSATTQDDINACDTDNGGCQQTCYNHDGSYSCSCNTGYKLKRDGHGCYDVDECVTINGGCQHTCTNRAGSYACSCNTGYALDGDGRTCTDIDECDTDNGGCQHTCTNRAGSYTCSCNTGYALDGDGRTCTDSSMTGDSMYHPTVECQSSAVLVTVDTLQVPNVDNVDMYVGDGNATGCQATMNGTNLKFSFELEACNPDISMPDNDTVQFTYHIQHDNDTTVGAVSRKHVTGIDVWCQYPRHGVVDVSYTSNMTYARYIGGASGTFTFTLSLYSDNTFATAYSSNSVIPVGTTVYADIKFENPSSELNMFVQECFATPFDNITLYKYELIAAEGCFGSDDTFAVVEANKGSKRYSFEFETFRFTGLNSSEVYLTCNLYVCQSSEPATGQCQHPHDCSVGRRAAPAGHDVYPISFGPIKLE